MKRPLACAWVLALVTMLCSSAGAQATAPLNLERAQQLYVICGACHGAHAQGERSLESPTLAGQNADYLMRQLQHFASGARGVEGDSQGQQMRQILATISSEPDWKLLVAYIQTLPVKSAKPASQKPSRDLYQTCAVCHGAAGEGNVALKAPRLNVLPDWYIASQLRKFKTGLRGAAPDDVPGVQMRAAAGVLQSDADIADVAAHFGRGVLP